MTITNTISVVIIVSRRDRPGDLGGLGTDLLEKGKGIGFGGHDPNASAGRPAVILDARPDMVIRPLERRLVR